MFEKKILQALWICSFWFHAVSYGHKTTTTRSLSMTPYLLTYKINQPGIDLAGFGK